MSGVLRKGRYTVMGSCLMTDMYDMRYFLLSKTLEFGKMELLSRIAYLLRGSGESVKICYL